MDKLYEPLLIEIGTFRTEVLFAEEFLPPLLAFLLQIPPLQVVNDSKVVELVGTALNRHPLRPAPEVEILRLVLPENPDNQ